MNKLPPVNLPGRGVPPGTGQRPYGINVDDPGTGPVRRMKRRRETGHWALAALVIGSGFLSLPMGYIAVLGIYLIVPPLLWAAGFMLFVGYLKALSGRMPGLAFWRLSFAFNLVGTISWLFLFFTTVTQPGERVWIIPQAMTFWCAFASCMSLVLANLDEPGAAHGTGIPSLKRRLYATPAPCLTAGSREDAGTSAASRGA